MLIGSWGPVVFEVSGVGAFTFSEMTQISAGRWARHETINSAPLSEFLGPDQDEIQLKMLITKMLNVNPTETYQLFRQMVRSGQNFPLIMRGAPLSDNFWYAENVKAASTVFAPGTGDILWAELSCVFKEYK